MASLFCPCWYCHRITECVWSVVLIRPSQYVCCIFSTCILWSAAIWIFFQKKVWFKSIYNIAIIFILRTQCIRRGKYRRLSHTHHHILTLISLHHNFHLLMNRSNMLPLSFFSLYPHAIQQGHKTRPRSPQSALKSGIWSWHRKLTSPSNAFFWRYNRFTDVNLTSDTGGCIAILLSKTDSIRSDVNDPISGGNPKLQFGWISAKDGGEQ